MVLELSLVVFKWFWAVLGWFWVVLDGCGWFEMSRLQRLKLFFSFFFDEVAHQHTPSAPLAHCTTH